MSHAHTHRHTLAETGAQQMAENATPPFFLVASSPAPSNCNYSSWPQNDLHNFRTGNEANCCCISFNLNPPLFFSPFFPPSSRGNTNRVQSISLVLYVTLGPLLHSVKLFEFHSCIFDFENLIEQKLHRKTNKIFIKIYEYINIIYLVYRTKPINWDREREKRKCLRLKKTIWDWKQFWLDWIILIMEVKWKFKKKVTTS